MTKTFDVSTRAEFGLTARVLAALVPRAESCGAELLLVGAAARDVVVTARAGSRPARATYDVDVAVAVAGWDGFRCVTEGLERVRTSEHKFLVDGVEVDVVPFGGVAADGLLRWPDDHVMNVLGFAEALVTAVHVTFPGGGDAAVADLPAQVVLKLMAWRDRGHVNARDAVDLLALLYDNYAGSLDRHEFDPALAAAGAVGCEVAAMLGPRTLEVIRELLDRECSDAGTLPAAMGVSVARNAVCWRRCARASRTRRKPRARRRGARRPSRPPAASARCDRTCRPGPSRPGRRRRRRTPSARPTRCARP